MDSERSSTAAEPSFGEWERNADEYYRGDPLWNVVVYRRAAYVAERADSDVATLSRHPSTRMIAAQLARSMGSIATSLSEGYSRTSVADRTRIYEYGLGSARESRDWYRRTTAVLGSDLARTRIAELTSIIRMLLRLIQAERNRTR